MNDLLFYTLLIAVAYYSLVYLPSQKSSSLSPNPLAHSKNTQTEPIPETEPNPQANPETIKKLQSQLNQSNEDSAKQIKELKQQITKLQSEIRDLVKRPLKPTHSKSTQTDERSLSAFDKDGELTQTLDTLIKNIQELNNSF